MFRIEKNDPFFHRTMSLPNVISTFLGKNDRNPRKIWVTKRDQNVEEQTLAATVRNLERLPQNYGAVMGFRRKQAKNCILASIRSYAVF